FSAYAPRMFANLRVNMNALFTEDSTLVRNFDNSVYPAITFNCGPKTTCLQHVDHANAPNSFCAITALGNFDPSKGGHLILFTLKIVIHFPPGSTILIPSATISHGNTPIQAHEERGSITQYVAGGLLRWVSYGFRSAKDLQSTEEGKRLIQSINGEPGMRWKGLVKQFSKISELGADHAAYVQVGM
ncbi:hypothetical protein BDN72DRAFT_777402, partial [Pluteus cervinus]